MAFLQANCCSCIDSGSHSCCPWLRTCSCGSCTICCSSCTICCSSCTCSRSSCSCCCRACSCSCRSFCPCSLSVQLWCS
ncbi:hypothetical protein C0J52_10429 [Blattella germanica]|nr:hypothetical protein C0J52_10429 [Blattella germanica]